MVKHTQTVRQQIPDDLNQAFKSLTQLKIM